MLERYGIRHQFTTPNQPTSNGLVERANRALLQLLRVESASPSKWQDSLPAALLTYNTTMHTALGCSPQRYLLSRKHLEAGGPIVPRAESDKWREGHPSFRTFAVGEQVLMRAALKGNETANKFKDRFHGPWVITRVNANGVTYKVRTNDGEIRAHHSKLKAFIPIPPYIKNHAYFSTMMKQIPSNDSFVHSEDGDSSSDGGEDVAMFSEAWATSPKPLPGSSTVHSTKMSVNNCTSINPEYSISQPVHSVDKRRYAVIPIYDLVVPGLESTTRGGKVKAVPDERSFGSYKVGAFGNMVDMINHRCSEGESSEDESILDERPFSGFSQKTPAIATNIVQHGFLVDKPEEFWEMSPYEQCLSRSLKLTDAETELDSIVAEHDFEGFSPLETQKPVEQLFEELMSLAESVDPGTVRELFHDTPQATNTLVELASDKVPKPLRTTPRRTRSRGPVPVYPNVLSHAIEFKLRRRPRVRDEFSHLVGEECRGP